MKNKISHDEIDLVDLFLAIWKKKIIVLFVVIISMILGFIYTFINKQETRFNIQSEIKPITVFEEARYKIYNSYVNSLKPYYIESYNPKNSFLEIDESENEEVKQKIREYNSFQKNVRLQTNDVMQTNVVYNLEMEDFDKKFLFNLFLDKISQRRNLENYMDKFELTQEIDDKNRNQFIEVVYDISSTIREYQKNNNLKKEVNPVNIEFETYNKELAKEFLIFIEKEANLEIQKNINAMFNNYIDYVESITKFQLEDIESKFSIIQDPFQIKLLEKREELLVSDKYIERIKDIYASSPVSKSNDFYAAKIIYELSNPVSLRSSMKRVLIVSGFFGIILGVIIALISKALDTRRLN